MPDFSNVNYPALNNHLRNVDWLSIFSGYESCDDLYKRFCLVIYDALKKFVPFKVAQPYRNIVYPEHIRSLFAQKQRLFEKTMNYSTDSLLKKISSDIDFHIRKFLANHERRLAKCRFMKPLYSHLRHVIKGSAKIPSLLNADGSQFTDDQQKADALACYISSVFSDSSEHCEFSPEVSSISSQNMSSISSQNKLCHFHIHPNVVLNQLRPLKPSISTSYDGFPRIIYRKCAEALAGPLCFIINSSIYFGEVPEIWKESIVTAIPKNSSSCHPSDFRPISISPPPIKVLEKLIRSELLSFLEKRGLIPPEQHGFLAGSSTTTILADCLHDWHIALNRHRSVDVIYFDLSKAFDKVNHRMLLKKTGAFQNRWSVAQVVFIIPVQ
ncbi:hypothetical protein Y032_0001g15 [Ancylostoma ceylanicum]|uniref:Reverse transcriptase domain-containing protein n=1 Tax=Ancylostoma ceylanicum TaxID=53326 RepID=A0A016W3M5_9BILA|nr:hypothetical protein Y032_0001g15 [Ancylostoma ceylanicum]